MGPGPQGPKRPEPASLLQAPTRTTQGPNKVLDLDLELNLDLDLNLDLPLGKPQGGCTGGKGGRWSVARNRWQFPSLRGKTAHPLDCGKEGRREAREGPIKFQTLIMWRNEFCLGKKWGGRPKADQELIWGPLGTP